MLTVSIDQSEGISGADIPEQAVKKMRTGSAALSVPARARFSLLFSTERLSTTILEPGTGYDKICRVKNLFVSNFIHEEPNFYPRVLTFGELVRAGVKILGTGAEEIGT